jgi:outer membrane protein
VLAAEAGRSEAKASRLPNLQLGARYADYGTVEGDFSGEWQATFQLSYPVFTGGRRTNVIRRAEAEERRATESLRLVELQMESRIDQALAAVQETGARKEALAAAAEQSQEVARIEHLALEAGAGVQTDYLTAEAELFRARAALTQARHGEIAAAVQLARAMGDLSVTWLEQNLEIVR